MANEKTIKIFDTTLRDGEQSPGFSMNLKEKIKLSHQLEKLGVDIIEAGFAIASKGDFESVKTISSEIEKATVASLARAEEKDIKRAYDAVKNANKPRLHIFLATSDIHMKYKLKMTRKQVLKRTKEMTEYCFSLLKDVEFSAEDATRSDIEFLAEVIETAIKAGAKTINLPDTVGYTVPNEYKKFLRKIKKLVPSLKNVTLSAHCHDDLGLGVANTLAGIEEGVTQVETTINGIGERAGNAALEEIVMSIKTRKDIYNARTNILTEEIAKTSNMLSQITGIKIPPNKAIVGANAFAHESGVHQHGVLANKQTYEIMTPQSIGLKSNNLILGKHSGKHALNDRLKTLGIELSSDELSVTFEKFKELADKKKKVFDKDLIALTSKELVQIPKTYQLSSFTIKTGNKTDSIATLVLVKSGKKIKK
ncbi:MAG: 2-isopropylmalate synthase, partial [Clostridiales Family XIII bacterium]|nr:2-isopropylmalate synthase [Clostridiales Family XIII bacterium]